MKINEEMYKTILMHNGVKWNFCNSYLLFLAKENADTKSACLAIQRQC